MLGITAGETDEMDPKYLTPEDVGVVDYDGALEYEDQQNEDVDEFQTEQKRGLL